MRKTSQVQHSSRPQKGSLMIKRCIVLTLFSIVLTFSIRGHASDKPSSATESSQQRDSRMQWWRDARFGMFVHWGLYSGLAGTWEGKPVATQGGMEWIQQRVKADTATYAKIMSARKRRDKRISRPRFLIISAYQ